MATTTNNEVLTLAQAATHIEATSFQNKELQALTEEIQRFIVIGRASLLEIAYRLDTIDRKELYKTAGFESVHEYAHKAFGYSDNMVYQLLQTSRNFAQLDDEGKVKSLFARSNGTDYSASQLQELNRLDVEAATALDVNGVISPSMTCKEIREKATALKRGDITRDGTETAQGKAKAAAKGKGAKDSTKVAKVVGTPQQKAIAQAINALEAVITLDVAFGNADLMGQIQFVQDAMLKELEAMTAQAEADKEAAKAAKAAEKAKAKAEAKAAELEKQLAEAKAALEAAKAAAKAAEK